MTIRWGVSPIAWCNDDMEELGGDTTLDGQAAGSTTFPIGCIVALTEAVTGAPDILRFYKLRGTYVAASDVDNGVDRGGMWMPQLSAAKNAAAEASLRTVEQCLRACGGSSYYTKNELSRLYRDVVAGLFQPSDQESLHGAWAGAMLGPVTD